MKIVNEIMIVLIRAYQLLISPLFPNSCRFQPTCSQYAITAFKQLGFFKALHLTIIRILKCNPFHPGGYDPVPNHKD
jgi:hypothetical protein